MTPNEPAEGQKYPVHVVSEFSNVDQELIHVTKDKLKLCLIEHVDRVERTNEWVAPASLLITIVATLTAATFHTALDLSAEVWTAIFVVGALGCACWLLKTLLKFRRSLTVDELVDKIMKGDKSA